MSGAVVRGLAAMAGLVLLAACVGERSEPAATRAPAPQVAVEPKLLPTAPGFSGAVLDGNGGQTGPVPQTATAIETGIGECALVRLKGRPPTDVLLGEARSGRLGREVPILYDEPGAKELCLFVNNRLDRIVRS